MGRHQCGWSNDGRVPDPTRDGRTHQFHLYPGCGHGFHCDGRTSYRPEAAVDAWGKTLAWFDQYLEG
ncbi:MAG: dienelactone hydrolase family protein [bacterium]|nr:dienelactone hydrolase family protein [bacterium]